MMNSEFYIDFSLLVKKEETNKEHLEQCLIFDCSTSYSELDINIVTVLKQTVPT